MEFEKILHREKLIEKNENDEDEVSPEGYYRLVSIIEHLGQSANVGHYIAICASNDDGV